MHTKKTVVCVCMCLSTLDTVSQSVVYWKIGSPLLVRETFCLAATVPPVPK